MRRTGFFRELDHGDADGPSLKDAVQATPGPDEAAIVAYLQDCPAALAAPSMTFDVLDPSIAIGGIQIQTDGDWIWPSDLAYYVSQYHVRPEPDFTAHMAKRKFKAPADRDVDLSAVDMGFPPDDGLSMFFSD